SSAGYRGDLPSAAWTAQPDRACGREAALAQRRFPDTLAHRSSRVLEVSMNVRSESSATRLLRAYQAQEKRFVERRFPLEFAPEILAIRELYSQAKGFRWNPETDIAWNRFEPARYSETTRAAARLTWSRRAWSVYPGLTESTALLIRFCLESGALGMDAK